MRRPKGRRECNRVQSMCGRNGLKQGNTPKGAEDGDRWTICGHAQNTLLKGAE